MMLVMKTPVTTYIGIGSNLGEREVNLRRALAALVQSPGLEVRRISAFLNNPAHGGPEGAPDFLNCAVEAQTTLAAQPLMKRLLEIEHEMGRLRREKWEPRIIDLDLLLHGDTIMATDSVTVPHPLMHERPFVLRPLAEIAPQAVHPVLGATIRTLLDKLRP
jgi:2-amino-4-hydroxy-6-hydroxymethyldihydropteridine diphosphokinase